MLFRSGEYLQVASLGVTRGCARSVAHWKLGMRGWAWGLQAGRRGRHREIAPGWEPGPGAPGSRTAWEALEEGAVQRLAGCAEDREGDFQHSNHLRTHSRAARARTHTHTHSYLQAVIALKIMGSICNNLGRKKMQLLV